MFLRGGSLLSSRTSELLGSTQIIDLEDNNGCRLGSLDPITRSF